MEFRNIPKTADANQSSKLGWIDRAKAQSAPFEISIPPFWLIVRIRWELQNVYLSTNLWNNIWPFREAWTEGELQPSFSLRNMDLITYPSWLKTIRWYAPNFQQQWKCSWPRDKPQKRERERKQSWMKLFPKAGQLTKSPVERRMKYILIITDGPKSTHWDCLRNILLRWWMMMVEMFIFLSQFLTHKVVISIDWKEGKKTKLHGSLRFLKLWIAWFLRILCRESRGEGDWGTHLGIRRAENEQDYCCQGGLHIIGERETLM